MSPAFLPEDKNEGRAAPQSFTEKLISRLPEAWQGKLAHFDEHHLPGIQSNAQNSFQGAKDFLGPLWSELQIIISGVSKKLAKSGPSATVGGTFRHLCFVGLNRAELLLSGETQSVFNENWADLASDNLKRHTALMFFAPRGLDGKPVNPYMFLVGEGTMEDTDYTDPNAVSLAQQAVGPMALLDLCRISPASPNTVNMLLVADTLFHWDIKDNYVLPTGATSWVRDVEQVLKSYPRTTRAHLYTQWETELLPPSDRITVHRLREFPLDDETWLNRPTLQERYGSHMMVLGFIIAGLTYAGLWLQGGKLQTLTDQLNVVQQQIPSGGQFSDLEKAIGEQEKMWQKRDLFPLVVKDTARAIQRSGMKVLTFEVRADDPDNPPKQYVVTIDAQPDAYQGWLQQEPIARNLILNSAVLDAIRKPPTTSGFKLEALVNANTLAREYKPFASQLKVMPVAVSGSDAPVSDTATRSTSIPIPVKAITTPAAVLNTHPAVHNMVPAMPPATVSAAPAAAPPAAAAPAPVNGGDE